MAGAHLRTPPERVDGEVPEGKMAFLEHLDELRTRIVRSCAALAAGMLVSFAFIDRIAEFVLAPTFRLLPAGTSLIMTRPREGVSFFFDVALLGGGGLAAPVVPYSGWGLRAPRPVTPRESPSLAVPGP